MHNIKTLIQNVGWLFIGTMFSNVISIFVTIFLIRKLPVEDFGIYSLFLGSLGMFGIFSINGAIVALRRYIPELIQAFLKNGVPLLKAKAVVAIFLKPYLFLILK